jgi:hypothetical protein
MQHEYQVLAKENHEIFCKYHGHAYSYEKMPVSEERAWPKVAVVEKAMREMSEEYLLWIDDDAIFTAVDLPFTFEKPIGFSWDHNGPCAGVMYFRKCGLSFALLRALYSVKEDFKYRAWSDQAAFHYFLAQHPYRDAVEYPENAVFMDHSLYSDLENLIPEFHDWFAKKPAIFHAPALSSEERCAQISKRAGMLKDSIEKKSEKNYKRSIL